jgi:hypothetical protein
MYSFAQRRDTIIQDEPFYGFYLKKTGIIHPGRKQIMQSMSTDIGEIVNNLLQKDKERSILFLKNMAHHHIDIDDHFLLSVNNVFLIRNPAELINSFSKVIKDPTMNDIGIRKSWELYNHLQKCGKQAVVLDSGELLKDPAFMLEKLCKAINIPYDKAMQSWPAGARREDGIWAKYWYHNVHKSTGFIKSIPVKVELPEKLQALYEASLPYYNELIKVSIKY